VFTWNIDYINTSNQQDGTQLDAKDIKELAELLESLKDELEIKQITCIELTEGD